jgi:hypothetical protein
MEEFILRLGLYAESKTISGRHRQAWSFCAARNSHDGRAGRGLGTGPAASMPEPRKAPTPSCSRARNLHSPTSSSRILSPAAQGPNPDCTLMCPQEPALSKAAPQALARKRARSILMYGSFMLAPMTARNGSLLSGVGANSCSCIRASRRRLDWNTSPPTRHIIYVFNREFLAKR